MEQFQQLFASGWDKQCKVPWSSLIVLAAKPHQEHVTNINRFIWRMCVSYCRLNGFTKPFQYFIPRCDDAVTVFNFGAHQIWIITLDARQGYHQVAVRAADKGKLAFFALANNKYFSVLCLLDQPSCLPSTQPR